MSPPPAKKLTFVSPKIESKFSTLLKQASDFGTELKNNLKQIVGDPNKAKFHDFESLKN